MLIVGINGLTLTETGEPIGAAGAGKDTLADILTRQHGFAKVALADPLKRICREVYDFTEEQLWGPSQMRNIPDERYPREHAPLDDRARCSCCGTHMGDLYTIQCYLTPRYALQLLGTQWGRHCYENTWVDYGMRLAKDLNNNKISSYDPVHGAKYGNASSGKSVSIPDVRFINEIEGIRKQGGKLVRVKRILKGVSSGSAHQSERESAAIPDSAFDLVIENHGTVEDLMVRASVLPMMLDI